MAKDYYHWRDDDVEISQCASCNNKFASGAQCRAYREQIPNAILTNAHDHRKPFKGDNGIRFEPLKDTK